MEHHPPNCHGITASIGRFFTKYAARNKIQYYKRVLTGIDIILRERRKNIQAARYKTC